MEQFWGNSETCRQGLCRANLIERIIFEYNQHWIDSTLDCMPGQARDQFDDQGDTGIDRDVDKNL
jgi:hypothetical protein